MADRRLRRRRVALSLLAMLMLAVAAFATLPYMAGWAALRALDAAGFGPARLEVAEIGLRQSMLRDLRLGPGIEIDSAMLHYTLGGLFRRQIELVSLGGVRLRGRIDAEGLTLGPMRVGEGGGKAPPFDIGQVDLEDGALALDTPAGLLVMMADGSVAPATLQGVIDLRFAGPVLAGAGRLVMKGPGSMHLTLAETSVTLDSTRLHGLSGTVRAEIGGAGEWALGAELDAKSVQAPALRLGTSRLLAEGGPERLRLDLRSGRDGPSSWQVAAVLQTPAAALAAGAGLLALTARFPEIAFQDMRLAAGSLETRTRVAWDGETLSLTPEAPLRLDTGSVGLGALALRPRSPLLLTAEDGAMIRLTFRPDGMTAEARLRLATSAASLQSPAGTFALDQPTAALRGGRLPGGEIAGDFEVQAAAIGNPAWPLAARGAEATGSLALPGATSLSFALRALELGTGDLALAPLALRGSAETADFATLAFQGSVETATGAGHLSFQGSHRLADGTGGAKIELRRLSFSPAAMTPADLMPWLDGTLAEVEGAIGLTGDLAWGAKPGLSGTAMLLVRDLSFAAPGIAANRLNGVIAFDSIWPPATAPRQTLAAEQVDVGLPLTALLATFDLDAGGRFRLENAEARLAGGTVRAGPSEGWPFEGRMEAELEVIDVDLARLLQLAGMEQDLEAEGVLSGHIPLTLSPQGAVIAGGQLTAKAPGVIRYRPREAPAALRQGGGGVDLMLQALSDFRYKALRLTLDRDAPGDTRIGLHIAGANPALHGGYPVELNVTLTGELDRMLREGIEGYRVPERILERMQRFGQSD